MKKVRAHIAVLVCLAGGVAMAEQKTETATFAGGCFWVRLGVVAFRIV
jgi:hypothetical protein